MFIRRTATRNALSGESYVTLQWPALCVRIEQLLGAQGSLQGLEAPAPIERLAQHYAAQLLARAPQTNSVTRAAQTFHEVAVDSLEQTCPRAVGVEHVGLQAMGQLRFGELLTELGFVLTHVIFLLFASRKNVTMAIGLAAQVARYS